jgi:hypothetical protein
MSEQAPIDEPQFKYIQITLSLNLESVGSNSG